ncbi:MAG: putative toxin-antitoxin system toxin component, PIN family [Chitinophagaceae bacterium]
MNDFFVFDTNSLVSASLIGGTKTARAMDKAFILGKLAFSNGTMDELVEVLFRKKFDKYFLNNEENWNTIQRISISAIFFSPTEVITACRDPKDDKFLELAISANASCIITGDKDLLILNPFRGIPILNAADFINNF